MTMDPFAGPQSPRTQNFATGGPQGSLSVEDAFTDGLTQMAYDTMAKANPSLMKDVVTFRVLDMDPDEGSGLGTFILAVNQEVFYVPVVVADNSVKPIDMFYSRRLNRYFPLTPEWIAEANKSALNELGQGVKPPQHLQNDVDITRVVEPPQTGRYGYASDKAAAFRSKVAGAASRGDLDRDVAGAFRWALQYEPSAKKASVLPELLRSMPNAVKTAFARTFKANPNLLRKIAALYGVKSVTEALRPVAEKTAVSLERPMTRDVVVVSKDTPLQEIRKEFGKDTDKAYSGTRIYGFYAKDVRKSAKGVLPIEEGAIELTQPKVSGLYRVYTADGSAEEVLILVESASRSHGCFNLGMRPSRLNRSTDENAPRVAVIFKDGTCAQYLSSALIAEPILLGNDTEMAKKLIEWTDETASNGEEGFFVSVGRGEPVATEHIKISTSKSTGGETRYTTDYGPAVTVCKNVAGPMVMSAGNTVTLTREFRWLKAKENYKNPRRVFTTMNEVLRAIESLLLRAGSKKVAVKQASRGFFRVGSDTRELPLAKAAEKIATDYGISLPATVQVLYGAVRTPKVSFWTKVSADDKPKKKSAPPAEEEVDPSMDPSMMDPSMMAPPAPPQPSGYELAIAEQLQLIQSQIAALNDKSMTLQQLQTRQQQIDGGGGMMASPTGAASLMAGPPQGPMGGMPMAPPNAQPGGMPPGGMPMDPSMGGMPQDPSMMGGPTPMDPSMGAAPPMDPAMSGMPPDAAMDPSMAGMPPDPSMMGPDPMDPSVMRPAMTSRDLDAGTIEQSINPAFLDMAGSLEQADVFDAAAIASLAQNKNLRSIVQSHLPKAEETLDNLGRMKLLFDLRESKIKSSIGNDTYTDLTQNLRDVFSQLGDLLLKLNQTSDQLLPAATG